MILKISNAWGYILLSSSSRWDSVAASCGEVDEPRGSIYYLSDLLSSSEWLLCSLELDCGFDTSHLHDLMSNSEGSDGVGSNSEACSCSCHCN